jgi:hypothetical protein
MKYPGLKGESLNIEAEFLGKLLMTLSAEFWREFGLPRHQTVNYIEAEKLYLRWFLP